MKKIILSFAATLMCLLVPTNLSAQADLSYLKQQCPQLTDLYQQELSDCHAHYIFAVDVSGSMIKYKTTVLPALQTFFKALPDKDRVTVIPFATTADVNRIGYDVEITSQTRGTLVSSIVSLYPDDKHKGDAEYKNTDIYEAQKAITKSIQANAQYDVNVVIFISDLLHCPSNDIDKQFSDAEMNDMKNLIKSAKREDAQARIFALKLPKSGKDVGFVLPKLQEIYDIWGEKIVAIDVPENSDETIGQWFNQQKDKIMFTKLQTIIIKENHANPIEAYTVVDIDGNVKATVKWTASKLYPKITMQKAHLPQNSSFTFKQNDDYEGYSSVGQLDEEDMELGKIKNKSLFFHQLSDTLYFDVDLPVPYQAEIDKLLEGRPGPVASSTEYKDQLIFTFFLPLWLTATILALIIIYILLVLKAISRNAKVSFNGKIKVQTIEGDEVLSKSQNNQKSLAVGAGGTAGLSVPGSSWTVTIKKDSPSPLLFWKKAGFKWSQTKGFVGTAGKSPRLTGRIDDNNTIVKLSCGVKKGEITHKVSIQYFPSK